MPSNARDGGRQRDVMCGFELRRNAVRIGRTMSRADDLERDAIKTDFSQPAEDVVEHALGEGIDASAWRGKIAAIRLALIPDVLWMFNVALFSGEGATGKSTLALQLCVQVAAQKPDWLTWLIEWQPEEFGDPV